MSANWSEGGSVSGWSALQPGIRVAVGLMTLNLFVWLSVRQWKGVQIAWGWQWLGLVGKGGGVRGVFERHQEIRSRR